MAGMDYIDESISNSRPVHGDSEWKTLVTPFAVSQMEFMTPFV